MTYYWETQLVKAKKDHNCDWCLERIKKKTIHCNQKSSDCGVFWQFRTHKLCRVAALIWNEGNEYDWYDISSANEADRTDLFEKIKKGLKKNGREFYGISNRVKNEK